MALPIRTHRCPEGAAATGRRWAAPLALAAASCGHPSAGGSADRAREVGAPAPQEAGAPAATVAPAARAASLAVTRARSRIHPTGRFDVDAWGGSVNTHTLLDSAGVGAVPVSECRFLWDQ